MLKVNKQDVDLCLKMKEYVVIINKRSRDREREREGEKHHIMCLNLLYLIETLHKYQN